MMRIEIIANQAVEQDMLDMLINTINNFMYTKIDNVQGVGRTFPKMGDPIWPEENFILIIYCDTEKEKLVREVVIKIKQEFPEEGIKYFVMKCADN